MIPYASSYIPLLWYGRGRNLEELPMREPDPPPEPEVAVDWETYEPPKGVREDPDEFDSG